MSEEQVSTVILAREEGAGARGGRPAGVSVVVPAFNEERAIGAQLDKIQKVMASSGWQGELIVVDDGSTDRTAAEAARRGVRVIRHGRNRGYGAALKTGIAAAQYELVAIIDADGTYPAEALPGMLAQAPGHDMVVGARTGDDVHIPMERRPAKWLLARLASYLAEQEIPDLNSGLRVLKKPLVERFDHLLPAGFSFTTTLTMALLSTEARVAYYPIGYSPRVGESKIRPSHAYDFLMLILRTAVYFNPLRVFLPLGAISFGAGLLKFLYDLYLMNLSESAVMFLLGGVIIWCVGLLADQNAKIALSLKSK